MSFSGGLYQGRLALEQLDQVAAEIAARMALGGRRAPTSDDVRSAAEELVRESVNIIRQSLDVLDMAPSVALGTVALSHLSGVKQTARRMLDAFEREAVTVTQLRADFAALLRGEDVDARRYGLGRPDLSGLRTVKSDMERLVADQIYDAAHWSEVLRLLKAGESVADWERSPGAKPCAACDELVAASPHPLADWPDRPHPWCQCRPRKRKPA